jgi:hypothetical protein
MYIERCNIPQSVYDVCNPLIKTGIGSPCFLLPEWPNRNDDLRIINKMSYEYPKQRICGAPMVWNTFLHKKGFGGL